MAAPHDHGPCDHDHDDDTSAGQPSDGSNDRRHGHSHGSHHHHHHGASSGNIQMAFFLNFGFSIVELVGGLWIGSLAIVADAIHDFGDSVSLGIAWFLEKVANRRSDDKFNFGYRRFSLLAALISGVVITAGSLLVIYQALMRFKDPHVPAGLPMIALAAIGISVNGFAAFRLSKGHTQNEKVLTWHLVEDVIGWAAVLVGGILIHFTGWAWIDPALALGLATFVSFNVLRYLKETLYLFLQGRPLNFDERRFLREVSSVPGIERVDNLAIWSLDGDSSVLSLRLHLHSVRDPNEIEGIKARVREFAKAQKARATLETCLTAGAPHEEVD